MPPGPTQARSGWTAGEGPLSAGVHPPLQQPGSLGTTLARQQEAGPPSYRSTGSGRRADQVRGVRSGGGPMASRNLPLSHALAEEGRVGLGHAFDAFDTPDAVPGRAARCVPVAAPGSVPGSTPTARAREGLSRPPTDSHQNGMRATHQERVCAAGRVPPRHQNALHKGIRTRAAGHRVCATD